MVDFHDRAEPNPYATKVMVALAAGTIEILMIVYMAYSYSARIGNRRRATSGTLRCCRDDDV